MSYNNPVPVVVALLRCENGIVVCKRAIPPMLGEWALPGGYVNEGENAQQAISREMREETGIIYPSDCWRVLDTRCTPRNQLLLFMICDYAIERELLLEFVPNEEASELKVAYRRDTLCFPLHTEMLRSYSRD